MQKIFLTFLVFLFPISLFGSENISSGQSRNFTQIVGHIISLGKIIHQEQNQSLISKIFFERDILMKNAVQIFGSFQLHILEKPTFDISEKYKLTLQKYKLSCEIAALRMVIYSIVGKSISEEKILASIPIFPGRIGDDNVWGDPGKEFVGSYTGSQRIMTGYGIYELPLAKYLASVSIESSISNNITDMYIMPIDRLRKGLEAIHLGSRVILWGDWCTSSSDEDGIVTKIDNYILKFLPISAKNICDRSEEDRIISWHTQDGTSIQGLAGEHVFLLLGYLGSIENPTHIIVWDTDTGKHVYRYSEWIRKWKLLDYRMLIVHEKI